MGKAVKARGEATARVWTLARVRLPLTGWRTEPTGRETKRDVLETPFFSWTAKDTPDYLTWDYQCRRVPVAGVWFPVMLQREVYAEARVETERRDASQVLREAEQAAC